jgi:hypothetical protein
MKRIGVVVPTIREQCWRDFIAAWQPLFQKHNVILCKVEDGDEPVATVIDFGSGVFGSECHTPSRVLGTDMDLIVNKSPACRMLGFATLRKLYGDDISVYMTFDDDTRPVKEFGDDPIQAHVDQLARKVPTSWVPTAIPYMRGFPYRHREESEVHVSHGVWLGVPDLDAPTQLVMGERPDVTYLKGVIPKWTLAPLCGMNIAISAKAMPYAYWAPVKTLPGCERFDDIWMGFHLLAACHDANCAVVTGHAFVQHDRASNVFKNLRQESVGIELNEYYGECVLNGDSFPIMATEEQQNWFLDYDDKRSRWEQWFTNTKV